MKTMWKGNREQNVSGEKSVGMLGMKVDAPSSTSRPPRDLVAAAFSPDDHVTLKVT